MKKIFLLLLLPGICICAFAQDKEHDRITAATKVLTWFSQTKEDIPQQLIKVTEGIIIVPKLLNAGLGIGGRRGRGIALVKKADGSWSNPVFVTLTGGSIGFQIGVQSIQLVLVFKDRATLEMIGKGSFTLGGDASVAAGPMGRNASASTDYKLEAEVYSYSRSKGLFAGISLSGVALAIDKNANDIFYGQQMDSNVLFTGPAKDSSPETLELKEELVDIFG